jgi:hypothetical protein
VLEPVRSVATLEEQGLGEMSKRVVSFRRRAWKLQVDVRGVPQEQLRVMVHGRRVSVTTSGECVRAVNATYELPATVDAKQVKGSTRGWRAAAGASSRESHEPRTCPRGPTLPIVSLEIPNF